MLASVCAFVGANEVVENVHITPKSNIVMFGFPGATSHHMILSKIGRELVERGHKVTFIRTNVDSSRVDVRGLDVYTHKTVYTKEAFSTLSLEMTKVDPLTSLFQLVDIQQNICKSMMDDEEIVRILKAARVSLMDPTFMCALIMDDYVNVPIRIDVIPVAFYDPFLSEPYGVPNALGYVPQMGTRYTPNMAFGERVHNVIHWAINQALRYLYLEPTFNALRRQIGVNITNYDSFGKVGIALYQTNWVFEFPRPISTSTQMVGPLLPEPAKALPEDLQAFMDSAPNGIVLVSFGTTAQISTEMAQKLADAFAKVDAKFLWKISSGVPSRLGSNTRVVDWIPQNDLLGNPNTRLFIAHGGANGMLEAAYHGVPVCGVPLFVDQWDNIMRAVHFGMAEMIDKDTFTADSLAADINKMLTIKSYRENAIRISRIINDVPKPPTKQAADWVEYAIRNEGANFRRLKALDLPWYVRNGFDTAAFFAVFFIVSTFVNLWILKKICCGRKSAAATKAKTN